MSSQRTYKKLGEFIVEYSVRNKSNAPIPVYSVTNDKGFCQGYFDKEVASKDKSTYKIVPRNYFAYNPSRINVGSIACQQVENKVIVSPLYVIFGVNDKISCPYLLYFLKSPVANVYINAYARGAVRNNFSFAKMSELMLPVPSVAEQEKIVKELDAIKEIIAAKYKQVDDLDNLAKALFCSIFGDPITNPKGWPVKKLGELVYIGLGFTHTPTYVEEGVPFLSVKDISDGQICWNNVKYVSREEYLKSPKGARPHKGDIMFGRVGTMGKPIILDIEREFCTFVSLGYLHINSDLVLNVYLKSWMESESFHTQVDKSVKGIAVKNLNTGWLKNFELPLPPLDLQQSFAAKIQAIEAQKTTLRQSIAEFESLLAQRLDYHFN